MRQTCNPCKKSGGARRTNRSLSKSLLPESASNAGQQVEGHAGYVWGILAGNAPAQACVIDQLGIDESSSHNLHSAERAKGGACSDRLGSSLFEGQRQRTWVQGMPGPESIARSDLCRVFLVLVNRCQSTPPCHDLPKCSVWGYIGNKLASW